MKLLFLEIFDIITGKSIDAFADKKSKEKESSFDENNFVVHYEPRRLLSVLAPLFVCLCNTISLYLLNRSVWFWIGFVVLVIFLVTIVDLLTYRCYVDGNGFTVKRFFIFKKHIPKEKFFNVEITKRHPKHSDFEDLMIVKNEKGKKIFTTSKGYVGFELMCEKAEEFEKENKKKQKTLG